MKRFKNRTIFIDSEDEYLLDKYSWYVGVYLYNYIDGKHTQLHRVIMEKELIDYELKNGKMGYVDHINRNPLDNRRCNLRVVSQHDNIMNRDKQNNNTSGYKGINITVNGTYHVSLKFKGIRYRKTLPSMEEAIEWRLNKIKELNIYEPELVDSTDKNKCEIKHDFEYRGPRGKYKNSKQTYQLGY
jgi:hypothetical protein